MKDLESVLAIAKLARLQNASEGGLTVCFLSGLLKEPRIAFQKKKTKPRTGTGKTVERRTTRGGGLGPLSVVF